MIVSPQAAQTGTRSGISWDEPACLFCGGERRWPLVEAPDTTAGGRGLRFVVVQCEDCGLCYTCPRPDRISVGQVYPADYPTPRRKAEDRVQRTVDRTAASLSSVLGRLSSRLRGRPCVERRALPWHGQGRVLDFGCGGGSFLERMRDQGWQVTGLDVSATTVERL